MRRFFCLLALAALLLPALAAPARADKPVVLGLMQNEADKYSAEFRQFDLRIAPLRQRGLEPSLLSFEPFYQWDWTEEQIYQLLKPYDAVVLITTEESPYTNKWTPDLPARAKIVGAALARYVQDGGGLAVLEQPVRYPSTCDERYWNLVLAPLGITILHEGCFDPTREYKDTILGEATSYWFTQRLSPHPVTAGVQRLYLPSYAITAYSPMPGIPAIKYSPEWQVVVSGEAEAKSFLTGDDNLLHLDKPQVGTYASAPPVVAVRELGQGRVVSFPLSGMHSGANFQHPLWKNTFESAGDRGAGFTSDGMKLLLNAYHWIGEPAQSIAGFGTHVDAPVAPVKFPAKVEWDSLQFGLPHGGVPGYAYPDGQTPDFAPPSDGIRGLIGAHSAYSDGKGSVAAYVAAAQAAGLSFIVFTDPLESLTRDRLEQLKQACAAASTDSFYACPGIEFTDGPGNRWALWCERVDFPLDSFKEDKWTYPQWDGKRMQNYGDYAGRHNFAPSALLDYKQLAATGCHRENLWWFYNYFALSYDGTQPLADNSGEYLFGLRDMRWASVDAYTRVTDPAQVAAAAANCWTGFKDVAAARASLNANGGATSESRDNRQYASQGPVVGTWDAIDAQMEDNWAVTRGAQRVRLKFVVRSADGIAEVRVHDADMGIVRRFLGSGQKELTREFEIVDDRAHYLALEVVDTHGKRAWSWYQFVYSYKQGLFRCGDNLNILCGVGLIWMPNAGSMLPAAKSFDNASQANLRWGWDGCPGSPQPSVENTDGVSLTTGAYPDWNKDGCSGSVFDTILSSYNLQITSVSKTMLSESFCTPTRPSYAMASLPRDQGPLDYYHRDHTIYVPMSRTDNYVAFNYRRPREAQKDYRGGLVWHEGEYVFTRDVTLKGAVPIAIAQLRCPASLDKGWGTTLVVKEQPDRVRFGVVRDAQHPVLLSGTLRGGGYLAAMQSLVGYNGFLVPPGNEFTYYASATGDTCAALIGLGHDGEAVKAGTVMKYAYAVGTFADDRSGNALLEDTCAALNLGGGSAGYPCNVRTGKLVDGVFFLTARADRNEAVLALGPRDLMIDLPIRVQGLENNGCAAVYSSARPWFRYVPLVGDTAYFQERILPANDVWVGNPFVCDDKLVKLTLVVDGQAAGKAPFLEVHNPTDKPLATRIWSPAHTPLFGGFSQAVRIPAGDSVRVELPAQAQGK